MNRSWLAGAALAGALIGAGGAYVAGRAGDGVMVRNYLLAHPEVIPEAMGRLQDRESGRLVARHRAAIVTPYAAAWAGNPKGDVTLVEYFDYNCGFCRASLPAITDLLARDPNLRVVYRELPILAETSRAAARVSLAAARQGRFAAYHDAVYKAGPVSDATIAAAARSAGVDTATLPEDADAEIGRNLKMAATLGLSGTPSWVVGDRILSGAQPITALEDAIRAARAR